MKEKKKISSEEVNLDQTTNEVELDSSVEKQEQDSSNDNGMKTIKEKFSFFVSDQEYMDILYSYQKKTTLKGFRTGKVNINLVDFYHRTNIFSEITKYKIIQEGRENNFFPINFNIDRAEHNEETKGFDIDIEAEIIRLPSQEKTEEADKPNFSEKTAKEDTSTENKSPEDTAKEDTSTENKFPEEISGGTDAKTDNIKE